VFEIHSEDIEQLETVREFNIWLYAIDDAIHIENVDALVEYLIEVERPEFVMAALDFKHKYLTDEN